MPRSNARLIRLARRLLFTAVPLCGFLPAEAAEAQVAPSERERIEAALPAQAPAPPRRPRKLLVFDLNVGYGGHPSAKTANLAFTLMGQKTGAYQTVVSQDPAVFRPDSLNQFDAVFLNNNVGNLFEDPALRQSLIDFVYGGGGLLGVHGTTVAFTRWTEGAREDWPEFGILLGGRGANHRAADEHVYVKLDDPDNPVNRPFGGQGFEYRSEFFRVHGPYSRDRVRVLFSIDMQKTDLRGQPRDGCFREDDDYALAWLRQYGRGRVFYCTIAHSPQVFWDPQLLQFYLAAVQFALGDLPAPATPSRKLTPAVRAQEQLGWRLGVAGSPSSQSTFFEVVDQTAKLGLSYIGAASVQKVGSEILKDFGPQLTDDELRQVRLKLDSAGVRLLTYSVPQLPAEPAGCRQVFEFARRMGIECIVSGPAPEALDVIERCCDEYDIKLALHPAASQASSQALRPDDLGKVLQGRSRHVGVCGDLGVWFRAGLDPVAVAGQLKDRLFTVQLHDLHELSPQGHDVPWGAGAGRIEAFLRELGRLRLQPIQFGLELAGPGSDPRPDPVESIRFFNEVSLKLGPEKSLGQ